MLDDFWDQPDNFNGRSDTRFYSLLLVKLGIFSEKLIITFNCTIVLMYGKPIILPFLSKCLDHIPKDFFKKLETKFQNLSWRRILIKST